jgi:hypothetical protein
MTGGTSTVSSAGAISTIGTAGSFTSIRDLQISASLSTTSFPTASDNDTSSAIDTEGDNEGFKYEDSIVFSIPCKALEALIPPTAATEDASPASPYTPTDALRAILFLPWLIAVGATLFLHPAALSPLVFRSAVTTSHSVLALLPRTDAPVGPLRRLAFYAETAHGAAAAFCALALSLALWGGLAGRVTVVFALGRAAFIWAPFEVGGHNDGGEDMRCVWAVLKGEEEKLVKWMVRAAVEDYAKKCE